MRKYRIAHVANKNAPAVAIAVELSAMVEQMRDEFYKIEGRGPLTESVMIEITVTPWKPPSGPLEAPSKSAEEG